MRIRGIHTDSIMHCLQLKMVQFRILQLYDAAKVILCRDRILQILNLDIFPLLKKKSYGKERQRDHPFSGSFPHWPIGSQEPGASSRGRLPLLSHAESKELDRK